MFPGYPLACATPSKIPLNPPPASTIYLRPFKITILFIYTIAEPIDLASGLVALATFAFQARVSLYTTVNSYKSYSQHVCDLAEETSVLSRVLGLLTETISASADLDLSVLELPLQ